MKQLNEVARLQQLEGILLLESEEVKLDKINASDYKDDYVKISNHLVNDDNEIYDFGGGEDSPFNEDEVTVVDYDEVPEDDNPDHKIHDLTKYIKLPPKKLINMSYSLCQIGPSPELKKTINDALKPGGYVVIRDYFEDIEWIEKFFSNYNQIYKYVYEEEDEDEIDGGNEGHFQSVFQK